MTRTTLTGLTLDELRSFVTSLGEKPYRAGQLFSWIYARRAASFAEMSDLSQSFRAVLDKKAQTGSLQLVTVRQSTKDATTKFLLQLADGRSVESVLIPPDPSSPDADRRLTLCLSTQVGCPLDCAFCATGTMGFTRNLTAGEIVEQFLFAQRHSAKRISNLVYMGMGEPMLNYDQVMRSVELLTNDHGPNIGAKHITISTAGYADQIRRMADERRKVKLALSLHSLDEPKRTALMPITKKFGIAALTDALDYYYRRTRMRPTLEYILFAGFNDSNSDADLLIRFSRRVPVKVNLIPFHSIDFTGPSGFAATLTPAPRMRIESFADRLRAADVTVMVRGSSGEDIEAACGQLAIKGSTERRSRPARRTASSAAS